MRRARAAALAALAVVLIVAVVRAQVQQEPFLETTEGTGINITCTHTNKDSGTDFVHFYRQLPGRAPGFLAIIARGSKPLPAIAGSLSVSEDGSWSSLWLAEPRRGDAAVYYCALGATGRGAGAAAGHEPPRAGPCGASRGRCRSARRAPRASPAPGPTPAMGPAMGSGPIPAPAPTPTATPTLTLTPGSLTGSQSWNPAEQPSRTPLAVFCQSA
ncbi:E3 ubiquitin-protein ligase TRIM33-like [Molothrus ater]|uniref:E3 ubiquitin-protein ligase TRIM33-like n=1 Tax=Molothrus ater TaxID=84834 RepID=UPI00174A2049|nr:E3 ubiquitin-protein ligase TRIM33-like [Molothrus ater]